MRNDDKLKEKLQASATLSKVYILAHFFDYRKKQELGNNFVGLLRSLLYELASQVPTIVTDLRKKLCLSERRDKGKHWVVEAGNVHEALVWAIKEVLHDRQTSVMIFMDALDELDMDNRWAVSDFIKELADNRRLKICLASRDDPPFPATLAGYPTLQVSERNSLAIEAWARQKLDILHIFEETESLAKQIAASSEGVFLWAHFVLAEARTLIAEGYGHDKAKIMDILVKQPKELISIYKRIIKRIPKKDRTAAGVYFSMVTTHLPRIHVFGPAGLLTISEFYEASTLAMQSSGQKEKGRQKCGEKELRAFQLRISSISGGMIVTKQEGVHLCAKSNIKSNLITVHVMHRTVREYFDSGEGWHDLFRTHVNVQEWRYGPWVEACARFFGLPVSWSHPTSEIPRLPYTRARLWKGVPYDPDLEITRIDLEDHVNTYFPLHLEDYERNTKLSSWEVVRGVPSDKHYYHSHQSATMDTGACACSGSQLSVHPEVDLELHAGPKLAISHNLVLYMQDYLEKTNDGQKASIQDLFIYAASCSTGRHADTDRTAILRLLADHAKRNNTPLKPLSDFMMYQAIKFGLCDDVKIYLESFSEGPLVLRPPNFTPCDCHYPDFHHSCAVTFHHEEPQIIYTPLHPLLQNRTYCGNGPQEYRPADDERLKLLQLFLDRGEHPDGQCGPVGNAVRAVIVDMTQPFNIGAYCLDATALSHTFDMLLNAGFYIHAQDRHGFNALELLWRRIHGEYMYDRWSGIINGPDQRIDVLAKLRNPIRHLLDKGAVNWKRDPNGRIPSVRWMRNFLVDDGELEMVREELKKGITLLGKVEWRSLVDNEYDRYYGRNGAVERSSSDYFEDSE